MLRELRLKKNISQKQLAEEIGWPKSRVSRLERGFSEMSYAWALDLAKYFNIDVKMLYS